MSKARVLLAPLALLGLSLAVSRYWPLEPHEVALEKCVYLGESADQLRHGLGQLGYSTRTGKVGELEFTSSSDGTRFTLHVTLDAAMRVASAWGIVKSLSVPGHPALHYKESRADVLAALGKPTSEKVDNYASRWAVYGPLKLTLVFDENDALGRAYLSDPAYVGPEESAEETAQ